MDYLTDARQEYNISLRVVRFELSSGSYENLVTNLPDHEFDMDDFKELYHLRWNQVNAYRDIKYPLCLKALHSKKYAYVVQKIWARAILHNFCSEIALNVEIEQNGRKYEYQMNYSEAVKTCRGFLRIHDGKSVMDGGPNCQQNRGSQAGENLPTAEKVQDPYELLLPQLVAEAIIHNKYTPVTRLFQLFLKKVEMVLSSYLPVNCN